MEEKITLKEFIRKLREIYKYVRLFQCSDLMRLESCITEFDKMVLVSNELEEYTELEMEIDNIKDKVEKGDVELLFFQFIPEINIPLFELKKGDLVWMDESPKLFGKGSRTAKGAIDKVLHAIIKIKKKRFRKS